MTPVMLFSEIQNFCKVNANEENVKKYSRYFKEGFDAYGVPQELFLSKVKSLLSNGDIDYNLAFGAARLLVATKKYEETNFAVYLCKAFVKQFTKSTLDELNYWFTVGITNWAHNDLICGEMFKPLLKNNIINYKDLTSWRTAVNKYQRRAAPVSLINLVKMKHDVSELLAFIDPMMNEKERETHQGLGWFLREAWKKDTMPVEAFLFKWKNDAARLIFQYATEKMTKEQKERFKREKK